MIGRFHSELHFEVGKADEQWVCITVTGHARYVSFI